MSGRTVLSEGPIDRESLAKRVAEIALLRGEFTLRSGRKSSYYLDKYRLTTRPDVLGELAGLLRETIERVESEAEVRADRLAGAELGGIPLVTVSGLATGRPTLFIRNSKKGYGTAQQIEGLYNAGERVLFVEDVATTAGQAIEAAGVLKEAGLEVIAIIAVIDRQEGAAENAAAAGLRFESLFTKADLGIDE